VYFASTACALARVSGGLGVCADVAEALPAPRPSRLVALAGVVRGDPLPGKANVMPTAAAITSKAAAPGQSQRGRFGFGGSRGGHDSSGQIPPA
jgi:hypothetical protein